MYLEFCATLGISPVPITPLNLARYVAYLGRSRACATVQQYLAIVRLIHLEMGLENPGSTWLVRSVIKGMKRAKGATQTQKLPITPAHLRQVRSALHLDNPGDAQFWGAVLAAFFGLLRVSNITVHCASSWDKDKPLRLVDLRISSCGCVLTVRKSKVIQFQERLHEVVLPVIKNNPLCPTAAILNWLRHRGISAPNTPLFAHSGPSGLHVLTSTAFRARLQTTLQKIGLSARDYGTHSLRRGGATWLFLSGVPVPTIKLLGDWKSDCVEQYLRPDVSDRLKVVAAASSTL